jgi:hypothetical protein
MAESFVTIGARHNSDKGTYHRYYEVYDTLLTRHRKTTGNILELGVYVGESMKVWVEAFSKAKIFGVDAHVHPDLELSDTWEFHQDDAYIPETLEWAAERGPFDVIIDDGPHLWAPQKFVCEHYAKLLSPRGTLVIEDIGIASWIPRLVELLPKELRRFAFDVDRSVVPGMTSGADHLLVVDITS